MPEGFCFRCGFYHCTCDRPATRSRPWVGFDPPAATAAKPRTRAQRRRERRRRAQARRSAESRVEREERVARAERETILRDLRESGVQVPQS